MATTLGLSDADFMAGKTSFSGRGGSVSNLGSLHARDGGYVALLGGQVSNDGLITARLGTVALAAGNKVSLSFSGDALVGIVVEEAALAALVANGQAIHADGGLVVLTAKGAGSLLDTMVNNSGEIRARTVDQQAGRIFLLGEGGAIDVAGRLDASAPNGGNGGTIETSGPTVRVATGTLVGTAAAQGANGNWLIDPTDFTIDKGSATKTSSGIGASTLQTALVSGNVTIQTQATGTEAGNININAPLAWSANKLTLEAHADINLNAVVSATGTSTLDLKTGYNFNAGDPKFTKTNHVLATIQNDNSFQGRIDFDRAGAGILAINGKNFTLINTLGAQGSTTKTDLQGINGNSNGFFALSSNIDASSTSTWNSGAGFKPITYATGAVFDGLGHSVTGLTIHQSKGSYVGLFGQTSGTIRNTAVTGASITANQGIGVLAGLSMGPLVNDITSGNVSGPGGYVGGLVGAIFDGQNSNLHAGGSVTSTGNNVGGLVGYLAYHVLVSNSSSSTNVTGTGTWTGGLVGQNDYGYIDKSSSSGTISGKDQTGGLVGSNNSGRITNSYSSSDVTGTGTNASGGTGGLVGKNSNGQVTGSYATGVINGVDNTGGLIGNTEQKGGVTAANTISTSYATGSVISIGKNVGGLIGFNNGNAVTNVYARSSIEATGDNVGGLIGNNAGAVTNAYATGYTSSGGSGIGGLIGTNTGTVTNSFWDKQTTGQSTSAGGGSATTSAEMKVSSLYTDASWNFTFHSGVWGRKSTLNDSYPVLRIFGYTDPITITLDSLALTRGYGDANPTLGATGWTVSGCDNNASCLSGVNWGSAISSATAVGTYSYTAANVLTPTLGNSYGKLSDYEITITPGNLTVNKALLSVTGSTATDKPYDRSNAASITLGTLSGLKNGETLSLSAGSATFDSANAGSRTASATLTLSDGSGPNAGLVSNYQLDSATLTGLAATISARAVNVAGQNDKPYDKTTNVDANLLKITNVIGGDSVALSGTATLAGADVGLQALAGFGGLNLDNPNYTLTGATAGAGVNVFPRLLSLLAAGGATRLYDGTMNAGNALLSLGGVIGGDTVTLSGNATVASKNVGSQALTGTGSLTINNINYTLEEATLSGNIAITALPVAVAAITDASRVYNGQSSVNASLLKVNNVVSGDAVTLSGTALLAAKDAGSEALSGLVGLSVNNSNYTVTGGSASGSVLITPKMLNVQANSGATRNYDGTTSAAASLLTLSGVLAGDDAILSGGSGVIGSKDVGSRTLTGLGSLTLSNGNYTLADISGNVAVTALPVQIAARGSKVYDGSSSVSGAALVVANAIGSDVVTLGGSAVLSSKNVGVDTIGGLNGLTVNNSNYTINGATTLAGMTVTALPVQVAALNGATRIYDATATAAASLLTVTGILPDDTATLSGSAPLASANVGNQALTSLSGLTLSNSNYMLQAPSGSVAITARSATLLTHDGASRVYDGTVVAPASLFLVGGLIGGDSSTLSGNAVLAEKNAGLQAVADVSGLTLSNNNYVLSGDSHNSVMVTALPLDVAAVNGATRVYDGTLSAAASLLGLRGVLAGDRVTLAGSATLAAKDVGSEALVNLTGLTVSNNNYTLTGIKPSGSVVVTSRPLSVTVRNGAKRDFNGANDAAASLLQLGGILADDSVNLSGSATLAANLGNPGVTGPGTLAVDNHNYALNSGSIGGTVAIANPLQSDPGNDIVGQASRNTTPAPTAVLLTVVPLSNSEFDPLPPNVKTTPANLTASFGEGVPLHLIFSPGLNEQTESVTLGQARRMVAPNSQNTGEREIRVPVSRDSLAEIVNGGVKLPDGVDQLLFVVKGN